jgi:hypothetical protein
MTLTFSRIIRSLAGVAILCAATLSPSAQAAEERDGQHDFDFSLGAWKTHIVRRLHPLSDSPETVEMNGTVSARKVWGGKAFLEEINVDGPQGHWQGASLFLYNPQARQWSQNFFNSAHAEFDTSLVGSMRDGRIELFSHERFDGRAILVRGVWSDFTPTSHRYTESYSSDGGVTWEQEFTALKTKDDAPTRQAAAPAPAQRAAAGGPHGSKDFAFDIGTWKTHSSRLMHPLTGSKEWREMDGVTVVSKVWDGRANLAEYKADGPAGHVELLALRLYNPKTGQWNINFATPSGGALGVPATGEFRNGRADFYDQEKIGDKQVLVRFSIWGISHDAAQSEQAFSIDGGKTWEVNWINKYQRVAE